MQRAATNPLGDRMMPTHRVPAGLAGHLGPSGKHAAGRAGKVRPADRAEHRRANRRTWAAMQAQARRIATAAARERSEAAEAQ